MATVVGRSPPDATETAGSPSVARLQTFDTDAQELSRSRSERISGDEKEELSEVHRESVFDGDGATHPDDLRPSEVLRVGSEIDSFVNRNRQASVAHLKLRPQASHALLPSMDHNAEFYDVVSHAVGRKNSLLGVHTEVKQLSLGDEWVEPFISGDPNAANAAQINVVRLSMSVAHAKAKLDGTSSKVLTKHALSSPHPAASQERHEEAVIVEPGTEIVKPLSPKSPKLMDADHKGGAAHAPHMDATDSLALNKQRQAANTMPQRKELMTGQGQGVQRSDSKDAAEEDLDSNRAVRILLPAQFAPTELSLPPSPSKVPTKTILKPCPIQYNGLASLQRQEAYIASIMDRMKVAAKFMKYNLQGKPNSRYFYITEDGTELHWTKTNPSKGRNKQSLTAEKPRKRFFADVRGVYYGPYNNRRVFRRFLDNKDQFEGSGKDWLCITVAFDDRTLDFCCTTDEQVSTWFLCMQALAPLAASYLTCGSVLWRRLIMKLNAYGLNPDRWPGPLQDPLPMKGAKKK